MVVGIYFFTFLISLGVLITLLVRHRRIITSIIFLAILITVSSFGRFLISVSDTMEMAQLGNLFLHVGGCFCPILIVRVLAEFCELKPPRILMGFLSLLGLFVFCLPMPFPGGNLYYSSLTLHTEGSFHYLVKQYGPLHFFYPLMLLVYLTVIVGIVGLYLHRNGKAHRFTAGATVGIAAIILLFYALDRYCENSISYSTHGYFIAMVALLWRMERTNMYDLSANIASSLEAMHEIGYLEFDLSYRCVGFNDQVQEMFPEISQWDLGQKVPVQDSFLYKEVILWLYTRKKDEKKVITLGDQHYELSVREIPYLHRRCVGYLLAMVNRTGEVKYMETIEHYNSDLQQEVEKKTQRISHIKDMLVVGMASMVESRDDSTGDHIKRTYAVMQVFTDCLSSHMEELGVDQTFLDMVTRAAPMHDLGKIAIDDAVLKKQGRFTDQDFEIMKVHTTEGARIVRTILTDVEDPEFVKVAENVAHYHHEKWDGTGYPEGLKGEEIPLEARMMALPDVFDALASKRRYKEALPYDVVFSIIEGSLGSHFDPFLGKLFISCRPRLEEMYRVWYEEERDKQQLQIVHHQSKTPVSL